MTSGNDILYENNNYAVEVAYDVEQEAYYYKVTNKKTNVIETQDSVLPKCISFAMGANDALEAIKSPHKKTPKLALPDSLN